MMSAIPESPFREMGVGPETLARVEEALKKKVSGFRGYLAVGEIIDMLFTIRFEYSANSS